MKLSIIIPVYNGAKFLEGTIGMLKNFLMTEVEFIMVDDGSTDNSVEIIETCIELDTRFHVIKKENGGVNSARNVGIENAKGELFYFLDCDDVVIVKSLCCAVNKMMSDPSLDLFLAEVYSIDENAEIMPLNKWSKDHLYRQLELLAEYSKMSWLFGNPIAIHAGVWRSSVVKKIGGFNTQLKHWEEHEMYCRAAWNNELKIQCDRIELGYYRRHPHGGSSSTSMSSGYKKSIMMSIINGQEWEKPIQRDAVERICMTIDLIRTDLCDSLNSMQELSHAIDHLGSEFGVDPKKLREVCFYTLSREPHCSLLLNEVDDSRLVSYGRGRDFVNLIKVKEYRQGLFTALKAVLVRPLGFYRGLQSRYKIL
ncbi:MAG: glycosyltransferase [Akkermansiaceae bacterium]